MKEKFRHQISVKKFLQIQFVGNRLKCENRKIPFPQKISFSTMSLLMDDLKNVKHIAFIIERSILYFKLPFK